MNEQRGREIMRNRYWQYKMKRTILWITLSFCCMIGIFFMNIRTKTKQEQPKETKEQILVKDVLQMCSYFYCDKSEREHLDTTRLQILLQTEEMPNVFLNVFYEKNIFDEQITKKFFQKVEQPLTYEIFKIICHSIESDFPIKESIQELGLEQKQEKEYVAKEEFLQFYRKLVAKIGNKVVQKQIYVLGEKESLRKDKEPYLVTTEGNYFYRVAFAQTEQIYDKCYEVFVSEEEIIYILEEKETSILIKNVWLLSGEGETIVAFVNGIQKTFFTEARLKEAVSNCVADIEVQAGTILSVRLKLDTISSKVLKTEENGLLLEKYGILYYSDSFRIYKVYDEVSEETADNILVGYSITEFVLEEGKICAVLIKEELKADKIRVLIQEDNYTGYYHKEIEITSNGAFFVEKNGERTEYKAEDTFFIKQKELSTNDHIVIGTIKESDKLKISSVKRADGTPSVRGHLEIMQGEEGLLLINELSLEEYLYAVVPSEMPTYYGSEALKVQAVCARSYAYNQLMANRFRAYGAHIDDSVACQVYNNIAENEASIAAVKATYGEVMRYGSKVATAYYFSTSCGHTASVEDVWQNAMPAGYLTGQAQGVEEQEITRLQEETDFRTFLFDTQTKTYDSESPWYRWTVFLSYEELADTVRAVLPVRYQANKEMILTKTKQGTYESLPITDIGTIKKIQIISRGIGGIITKLQIKGSKKTVQIEKEYNIRALLAPNETMLLRNDGTEVGNMSLLPSAFFAFQEGEKEGKKGIWIYGGGYGHGVGMSQTGVRKMAEYGYSYQEMIQHYYTGVEIGFIY